MRHGWFGAVGAAAVVSTAVGQMPTVLGRTDLRERFVVSGKQAYGLLPPDLAATPSVEQAFWSRDGRYLLLRQVDPEGAPSSLPSRLAVWDRRARRLDIVWRQPSRDSAIGQCEWLAGTATALVVVGDRPAANAGQPRPEARLRVLRLSAAGPSARPILSLEDPDESVSVVPSPDKPLAILVRTRLIRAGSPADPTASVPTELHSAFQVVRGDGSAGPPIEPSARGWGSVEWPDGRAAPVIRWVVRGPDRRTQRSSFILDAATGRLSPAPAETADSAPQPAPDGDAGPATTPPLRLNRGSAVVAQGETSRTVHPLWLEAAGASSQPRVLVAADCASAVLSPAGDAVLYVHNGAAWVVPLARVPASTFVSLYREALMQDAKQMGLALRMYSQDYDDRLPLPEHVSVGAADPYLRDRGAAAGFSYTFPGGPTSDIKAPSETPIGFLPGPGGRAVVYADGHVGWEPSR